MRFVLFERNLLQRCNIEKITRTNETDYSVLFFQLHSFLFFATVLIVSANIMVYNNRRDENESSRCYPIH